ncbi:MAG: hypothetical protein Q8P55_01855 [bacterium]|nr:hypothetical protein [bacterium]
MTVVINKERPRQFQLFQQGIHPGVGSIMAELFLKPEFQRLSRLVEKNPYHDSENVLEHVQSVFANCQELLSFDFVKSPELRKRYEERLSKKIDVKGTYTRKDLLVITSGLHDIGKGIEKEPGVTILEVVDQEGNTKAAGHEHAGSSIIPGLLSGFDLTSSEIATVQSLVDWHDTYSETWCKANLTQEIESDIQKIRNRQPLFYPELLLHILADNWGAEIYKPWSEYFLNQVFQRESFLPGELRDF